MLSDILLHSFFSFSFWLYSQSSALTRIEMLFKYEKRTFAEIERMPPCREWFTYAQFTWTKEFGTPPKWALNPSQSGHEVREWRLTGRSEWVQWFYGDLTGMYPESLATEVTEALSVNSSEKLYQHHQAISILKLVKLCRKSSRKFSFTKSHVAFSPGARGKEIPNKTSRPPRNFWDSFSLWTCSRSLRWLRWVLIHKLWNHSKVIFRKLTLLLFLDKSSWQGSAVVHGLHVNLHLLKPTPDSDFLKCRGRIKDWHLGEMAL